MMNHVCKEYPVSDKEYKMLDKKFGDLAKHIAWKLVKANTGTFDADFDNIHQEICMSMVTAASYYKKQGNLKELVIDKPFTSYCKSIMWNRSRSYGKILSRNNRNKKGEVSLSQFDYWAVDDDGKPPIDASDFFARVNHYLETHDDDKPLRTWNILRDPKNAKNVFVQSNSKKIQIKIVRDKTRWSYVTIRKQIDFIQEAMKAAHQDCFGS